MTTRKWRDGIAALRFGALALTLLTVLIGSPAKAGNPPHIPGAQYEPTTWASIDGWANDDHDAAFATFINSCNAILSSGEKSRPGRPIFAGLYKVCQKAVLLKPEKPGEAREFFEKNFTPVRISPLGSPDGFLTGYYEPIVVGKRTQGDGYNHPLYRKPAELLPGGRMAIMAAAASGKKKAHKRKLVAFHDRTAIDHGVLAGRNLEICWLKDPIDSFFAQIQGSVRVRLDDGSLLRLNYQAANGQPYYAVGRWLIDQKIIPKDEMSMDRIREWMERNPKQGEELRRKNKSYVFFRETNLAADEEPIGAQGISLTPGRSIAVDHKLHVYGTPFFISAYLPIETLKPDTWFRRLMIAQDTGGAIVGPARADIYFGAGDEAESVAGRLRHYGKFVMLVPKVLEPEEKPEEIPIPRPRPSDLDALIARAPSEPTPQVTATVDTSAKPEDRAEKKSERKLAAKLAEPEKAAEKKVEAKHDKADKAEKTDKTETKSGTNVAAKSAEPEEKAATAKKQAEKKSEANEVKHGKADKADKKSATKVAARSAEPEKKTATEKKAEAEKKAGAKESKHDKKKHAKAEPSRTDVWESRVMPKLAPETSAKKPKSKKKE
jgi:membrane-bound lytic murein transglycosylase A